MTHPGMRLRSLARRFCDPATMDRLIDPALADLQREYGDATRAGDRWHARWVLIAGYTAVLKVAAIGACRASTRERSTADGGAVGRTIRFAGIATTLTTAILMWMPLRQAAVVTGDWKLVLLSLYVLPQALAVTLPMGLVFGILCGLRGREPAVRSRATIMVLAAAASLAALALIGWLLPAANQAFRELTFSLISGAGDVRLARGLNELSLRELASRDQYTFHQRLALAAAPLVLGWFSMSLAAAARPNRRAWIATILSVATCFAYYVLLYTARAMKMEGWLPAVAAGWMPNLVFVATTLLLHLRTRGRSAADPSRLDDGRRSEGQPAIPPA